MYGCIWPLNVSDTQQYLEAFNFVDMLNWIVDIKLFDHLIVCKQMTDVLLNCQ